MLLTTLHYKIVNNKIPTMWYIHMYDIYLTPLIGRYIETVKTMNLNDPTFIHTLS